MEEVTTIPTWVWGTIGFLLITLLGVVGFFAKWVYNRMWSNIDRLWLEVNRIKEIMVSDETLLRELDRK